MASGDNIERIEVVQSNLNINSTKDHNEINETSLDNEDRTSNITRGGQDAMQASFKQSTVPRTKAEKEKDRERKIGHRRVGVGGEITYKKIQSTQIMGSIQLGIQHAVGGLASKPERDLLMQDFMTVETTNFPAEGSNHTPAHHYSEFKFKNYAPIAFRYFRDLFGIQPDDFLMSMCSAPLRELSNPGASGSIFYLTDDDEFIIKTVQHKEGEFLQKLLAGYYMNLNQNPRTLLPKFFGLYCYQCNSKNVRLAIMNNLLPSAVILHQKYDLKGSTYKRKASKAERQKRSPTYKDLDFMEHHPDGILMEADTYSALVKTIQRDCRVLESFKIMDYSLLVGVHNLDQAQRDKAEKRSQANLLHVPEEGRNQLDVDPNVSMINSEREREKDDRIGAAALNRSRSINRQKLVAHSTAMESIQAESEPIDEEDDVPPGGIPARNAKGERLLLFIGIIDILQSYRLKKKLEHTWKSMIHDGDTVSVHRPSFYALRFQEFMAKKVFKKIPSLDLPEIKGNHRKFRTLVTSYIALKHSPSKRKSLSRPSRVHDDIDNTATQAQTSNNSNNLQNGNKSASPPDTAPAKALLSPSSGSQVPQPLLASSQAAVVVAATTTATSFAPSQPLTSPPAMQPSMTTTATTTTTAAYPVVLTGRPNLSVTSSANDHKPKVPPPVPPRGTPKTKKSSGGGGYGAKGVVPSCCSTPPPTFDEAIEERAAAVAAAAAMPSDATNGAHAAASVASSASDTSAVVATPGRVRITTAHHHHHVTTTKNYREDAVSITDIRLESRPETKSSLSVESGSSSGGGTHSSTRGGGAGMAWTPPASVEGSTPTWTEGTPSFTESSSSGDMGCPTTPHRQGSTASSSKSGHHKKTVERAINCLTTEMTHL